MGLWYNEELRKEFLDNPKTVLARESHLELPERMRVKVLEDAADRFHFILPRKPAKEEFNYRYQQIADWWMLAHYLGVRQLREGKELAAVDAFRKALHVVIIGHVWFDLSFKQAMIRNAKAALESETGATFPPSLNVVAPEDTDDVTHIAIPKRPEEEGLLEDSQHLSGWFAAGHAIWYFLVSGRLLRPLPQNAEEIILA